MEFTFVNNTGVAFFREDAEEAQWTQEEMSLVCTFPYDPKKVIERGMIVMFRDPATDQWSAYEVRNCSSFPGENYQQFEAEDIAISELTDCHIANDIKFTDTTAGNALAQVLTGTGWNVGTTVDGISSCDIVRGSVWQAVNDIQKNWNIFIVSRVTVNATGISGRFLDVVSSDGVFRGLRMAVDKNVTDPCVTYDDTELATAMFGYGGTYTGDDKETHEYTFADIAWQKTAEHPAKPYGLTYIEMPEKTALYGRNGRARFGYYQNTNIDDPGILLQKTFEQLKQSCDPKISITGTVTDLKRIGYADQPIRLHDMVIVELEPMGVLFYKQVIKATIDLLNPTGNYVTIGDYIPNIIYINRKTDDAATGGRRGGGGGRGSTKVDLEFSEYRTIMDDNGRQINMAAQRIDVNENILQQAGMQIDPITGVLIYAEDNENNVGSKFRVQSDRITAEVTDRKNGEEVLSSSIVQTASSIRSEVTNVRQGLESSISQTASSIRAEVKNAVDGVSSNLTITANQIRSEVNSTANNLRSSITQNANKIALVVEGTGPNMKVNSAAIIAEINKGQSSIKIKADTINLSGYVTASQLSATDAKINNLTSGATRASSLRTNLLSASTGFTYQGHSVSFKSITIDGRPYHLLGY